MRLHELFEWNPAKARANLKKHGVSFDDAAAALSDPDGNVYHVEEFDDAHSTGDDRFVTTCSDPEDRSAVLCIVWTERAEGDERVTRIISARAATPRERKSYVEEIIERLAGR